MAAEWVLMAPNGVVSCLSWCLLTCNSFEDAPVLRVEDAPPGKELKCCREPWLLLRCSPSCLRLHTSRKQRQSDAGQGTQRWMLKIGDCCCGRKPWLLMTCSPPGHCEEHFLSWMQGDAEALSFEDGSMNSYTVFQQLLAVCLPAYSSSRFSLLTVRNFSLLRAPIRMPRMQDGCGSSGEDAGAPVRMQDAEDTGRTQELW